MSFKMEIFYACVVKETAFLRTGWGFRDVRGPYLVMSQGQICIPNIIFDKNFHSNIIMTFSLSNTCQQEAIEVSCSYLGDIKSGTILRNDEVDITIPEVIKDSEKDCVISISASFLSISDSGAVICPALNILALNKITVERNINPTILY